MLPLNQKKEYVIQQVVFTWVAVEMRFFLGVGHLLASVYHC